MRILKPSPIEDSIDYMDKQKLTLDLKDSSDEEVRELRRSLTAFAARNCYRNIVLKIQDNTLYAF